MFRLTSTQSGLTPGASDRFTFRAVTGLPAKPLPSYASYVLEGSVNLQTQSGVITKAVYAGRPEAMSDLALPGFSQTIRVTQVRNVGDALQITGVIADPSQREREGAATVELEIDRTQSLVRTGFRGTPVILDL
jgi:hypothetical protein